MSDEITIGNDDLILYIRKRHPQCKLRNNDIGRKTWTFMRKELGAKKKKSQKVIWDWGKGTTAEKLPKTAHQFELDRSGLPQLYEFLDQLGSVPVTAGRKRK